MKTILSIVAITLALAMTAFAQTPSNANALGSPVQARDRYSANYAEVVRGALPKVDAAAVTKLMSNVRAAAATAKPMPITDPRQLEKVFGLSERGDPDALGYVDAGDMVYRVDTERQRIYLVRRQGAETKPVPRKEFAPQLSNIRAAHADLARRLGVPDQEVMFTDFREILSETNGRPELQRDAPPSEIMAEGAVTTILRAVGGVLVEGSEAKLSSVDAKQIDLVDVRWPQMRVSEAAMKNGFRGPQDAEKNIVERISASSKGQPVSVRMAVVLRPLAVGPNQRVIEYVPALKVKVKPQAIRTENGYRTDAGEVFYVDLVRGAPAFADPPSAKETPESKKPADRPAAKP